MPAFDYIHFLQQPSLHVLILDPLLLKHERCREHSGVNFLQHTARLKQLYTEADQQLHLLYGAPAEVVRGLLAAHPIKELVFHEDFSPYARLRDRQLRETAEAAGVDVVSFDEQALLDLRDFQRWNGRSEPYKVFTSFYRKWSEYRLRFYRPASGVHVRQLATTELAPGLAEAYALPAQLAAAGHEPGVGRSARQSAGGNSSRSRSRGRRPAQRAARLPRRAAGRLRRRARPLRARGDEPARNKLELLRIHMPVH